MEDPGKHQQGAWRGKKICVPLAILKASHQLPWQKIQCSVSFVYAIERGCSKLWSNLAVKSVKTIHVMFANLTWEISPGKKDCTS